MPRIWIDTAAVLLAATLLGGCATSKEKLLPHGDSTMLDIWHQETGSSAGGGQAARQLLDARQGLRRPLVEADVQAAPGVGEHQGGLGIGLAMVERLVRMHGGSVWAESDGAGRGSTFVVRLPLRRS